ncbi:LANO_0E01398g1_1 [Lachancea nothofagi CBS 11611]|uniref:Dynactin subunit 4 n=1 Tax=Lachancea nothofagi CBS 11611 TaxID=1266666 RepID=A0A1G4JPQ6_9SACH|nr:LANO_0E01398g1_1 [Lachancea nothofagi CBS 11611]
MLVKWLCGCSREPKSIHDLSICAKCHRVSCNWCQKPELLIKYCPGCYSLSEFDDQIRCTKSCFECPRCQNQISIAGKKSKSNARQFLMKCHGCGWTYETADLGKTRSLTTYVETLRDTQDSKQTRFRELQQFYDTKRKLQKLDSSSESGRLETLDKRTSHNIVEKLDSAKLFELINEEIPIPLDEMDLSEPLSLPQARGMHARYNYTCSSCHTWLSKRHPDPKSSRYLLESYAALQFPELKVVPLSAIVPSKTDPEDIALVFSASNQARESTEVSLVGSATVHIPLRQFTLKISGPSLPIQTPADELRHFATLIPTYQLTGNNSVLEHERARRSSKGSSSFEVAPSCSSSGIVDQGNGWAIIPVRLLEPSNTHQIQITVAVMDVYVTIQAIICNSP